MTDSETFTVEHHILSAALSGDRDRLESHAGSLLPSERRAMMKALNVVYDALVVAAEASR